MLLFCPMCGTLLQIRDGTECNEFACTSCSYKLPVSRMVTSRTYPRLKDLDEVLGGPSAWENAQITEELCPKCAHEKAYYMELQTRSADEPSTIFYRCANSACAHRWKE